jgi:hypothetical protein
LFFFSASAIAQISAPTCKSASWQWVCMSWFRQYSLSDLILCVQTFNSLGQSPCDVTAYMMSTCNEGGEFLLLSLFCVSRPCDLISWQSIFSTRYPRDTTTLARVVLAMLTCAIAAPLGILSLVHVSRAKERNGSSAATSFPLLNYCRLIHLSIAGRNGLPTAQRLCLPGREFLAT